MQRFARTLLLVFLAQAVTPARADPPSGAADPPTSLRPFAYGAFAAGAGAFVAAALLGACARDRENAHHSTTDPARLARTRDEGEAARDGANLAFLAAGVLAAAGMTLWVLEPKAEGVAVSPEGLAWSTRF